MGRRKATGIITSFLILHSWKTHQGYETTVSWCKTRISSTVKKKQTNLFFTSSFSPVPVWPGKKTFSSMAKDSDVTPLEGPPVLKFQAPLPRLLHPPLASVRSSTGTSGDGSKITVRLFNNINIV